MCETDVSQTTDRPLLPYGKIFSHTDVIPPPHELGNPVFRTDKIIRLHIGQEWVGKDNTLHNLTLRAAIYTYHRVIFLEIKFLWNN